MAVVAIVGGQWGDEGKGKIIDHVAEKAALVARFSGGDNAGHTVINPYGEFRLHLVPSGIFNARVTCIIGNGVAVNPAVLLKEIDDLHSHGVSTGRLFISDRAHLIMPYHTRLDALEEQTRSKGAIGTTHRGIGPAFADKTARVGIRTGDLLDKDLFRSRLSAALELKNTILTKVYQVAPLSLDEIYDQYCAFGETLAPFIRETSSMVRAAAARGEFVLLEGAQGALLDPDFGTYPYVTSSSPLAGAGCIGVGLGPREIDRVVGVFKAYNTRVGAGPMPTELTDEVGDLIRTKAHEYGATTSRPRRCGWFDAVAGRFSVQINGLSDIALTHLDIYDSFPTVKICTAYKVDGDILNTFPGDMATLEKCHPIYEELKGWQGSISDTRSFEKLPMGARQYLSRLEDLLSCPVSLVSVGPGREQVIPTEAFSTQSSGIQP
ncbi:MAG: adenylosuccinate synthase [Dehalococcoidia bacterium]|nr:adenylosuccinate synthase [Dehalococcoidia bacterium]